MKASANRTQDNESRAVANNFSCKREEREAVRFVDNSSHTKSIAQLQAIADRSVNPHDVQMRKLLAIINNSPQRKTPVLPGVTQKKGPLDEDELQFKKDETVQCKGKGFGDEEELQFKAEEPVQKQENKTGLPDDLKAGVENLSGMAMDDVRVHYNSSQPAQLNAYAYTQGQAIYVAPGQEKHLPHEAWHVVQQKQGRVQPTMQMAEGVAVNDDKGLEKEADVMGRKAFQPVAPQPEAVQLRELQDDIRDSSSNKKSGLSPINTQLRVIQSIANNNPEANQVTQMQAEFNNRSTNQQYSIQRKVYIGKGSTEPIEENGKVANELRAEADNNIYPVYMKNAILNPAISTWEIPVRVAKQSDVLPFLKNQPTFDRELSSSFKKGDKLYGMEKARKEHTDPRRGEGRGEGLSNKFDHPTVDSMNKALGVGFGKIDLLKAADKETANYAKGLIKRNPDLSSKESNVNFKEACKKAIEYITKDTDGFIHFELDKVDLAAVVTKKFDSITGAELRKIFREVVRAEWAEKNGQKRASRLDLNKIKFYMKGKEVAAPWDQEPELWAAYRNHRIKVRDRHYKID
ncbi:DUF4157 domain-containing protein [Candidatus Electronema sp. PJ]|uniref:eCIS core domain-containing protein n=1 Tax=Candidatus Electronema sp. PJ TaxID=3401572 RepID=UPI003AA82C89